jgi:rhodanese-related sulfurtransferase
MKSFTLSMLLLLFAGAVSCQSQPANTQLNAQQFEDGIRQPNIQLLDVRTAAEYKRGHLAKSLQADWNNRSQFEDRTQHLDKNKPLYVYCLSGGRSAAAASWLRAQGYKNVYELIGGFNGWVGNNKPVEGGVNLPQLSLEAYQAIANSGKVVLVDFGASWCPPCKKMEPILAEIIAEKGNLFKFAKVDGGNDYDVMKAQQVEALPVFILYKNGKEMWRHQGLVSKEELDKQIMQLQ